MKRGGDAGGPVKKVPIEVTRQTPKFLVGLKKDLVRKEAKLEDKFLDKFKNDFIDKEDEYDLENAQVVKDNYDDDDLDDMPQIMPNHRKLSESSDKEKKNSNHEKNKKDEPVTNLNEFHPTFKSKKPQEHKPEKTEEKHKAPELKKSSSKKSEDDKKPAKSEEKKSDSVNQKRGLDDYVKEFGKEEELKKKKVKSKLLSFNEDE